MNFVIEILIGSFIFFFILHFIKFPKEIRKIINLQIAVCFITLLVTHIYAYLYYSTYPGLGGDSLYYDLIAKIFSENFRNGFVDFSLNNLKSTSFSEVRVDIYSDFEIGHIPFGFVLPLSFIYYIFGYNPFIGKIFNLLTFILASKQFYFLLLNFKINKNTIIKTMYIFALWPPLLISSVSLTKESLMMLTYISVIRYLVEKNYRKMIPWFILAILIRPYSPILVLLGYFLANLKKINPKIIKLSVISILLFIGLTRFVNFKYLNLYDYVFDKSISMNTSLHSTIRVNGAWGMLIEFVKHPIRFINVIFMGFVYLFFKPDPWHLPNWLLTEKYANAGKLNFSGISYYIHTYILFYVDYSIIRFGVNSKKIMKDMNVRFIVYALINVTIFNSLRAFEIRYLIMSGWPFMLVLYANVQQNALAKASIAKFLYISIIIVLIIFPMLVDL